MTKKIEKQVVAYAVIDKNTSELHGLRRRREDARELKRDMEHYYESQSKIIKLKGDEIVR